MLRIANLPWLALAALEFRRVLRSGILLGVIFAAGLAVLAYGRAGLGALGIAAAPAPGGAFLQRGLWEYVLVLLAPALALHAAARSQRWRAGEADWLAPRIGRAAALGSTAAGLCAGAALLALIPALAGALASALATDEQAEPLAERLVLSHHLGRTTLIEPEHTLAFAIDDERLPSYGRLRMRVGRAARGGRARDVRLVLWRGERSLETALTLAGDVWMELSLPTGTGPLAVGLRNEGQGDLRVPATNSVQVFGREASRLASRTDIWLRAVRALAVIAALALGLGTWMGAEFAAALALGIPWLLTSRFGAHAWLPWSDLLPAVQMLGEGRLGLAVSGLPWLTCCLWIALGIAIGRAGLRNWSPR